MGPAGMSTKVETAKRAISGNVAAAAMLSFFMKKGVSASPKEAHQFVSVEGKAGFQCMMEWVCQVSG